MQQAQRLIITQFISRSHYLPIQVGLGGSAHQLLGMNGDGDATVTQAPTVAKQENQGLANPTRVLTAPAWM